MRPVLDMCCGGRLMYFDKADERVLAMDIREGDFVNKVKRHTIRVHPDVLCDFTALPYEDETFYHVVFDPPHAFLAPTAELVKTYGFLQKDTWEDMLRKGFSEGFRVLKPNGTLIFKWAEVRIPLKQVLALTPYKPLYGHRSGRAARTHWCAFIKPGVVYLDA